MSRPGRFDAVLVGVALLLGALFAWMIPVGANPDEDAHRALVGLMARNDRLIVFVPTAGRAPVPKAVLDNIARETGWRELPEGEPSRDEAHQPPLYYALAALVRKVAGDVPFPVRAISLLFHGATVWLLVRGLRGLFPTRPWIAAGAAAFAAVLPVAAQLGGAISNDAAAHFFSAWFCLGCARLAATGPDRGSVVRLGAVLGLGLLTKTTVLQLVPLLMLAAWMGIQRTGVRPAEMVRAVVLVLGIALLLAFPWFMRNSQLYGDPLARTIYAATGPNFAPSAIREIAGWSVVDYARQVGVRTFATMFYFLDPNLPFPRFTGSPMPLAMVLIVAIGGGAGAWKAWREERVPVNERIPETLLAAAPWLLVPFSIAFSLTVFQAQGRYLLPALAGFATVFASGWSFWTQKRPWLGAFVPATAMLVLSVAQMLGGGFVGGSGR
ncbi:MAG: glycosyltransferase family 39 protein [Armatimonadota bacterium]